MPYAIADAYDFRAAQRHGRDPSPGTFLSEIGQRGGVVMDFEDREARLFDTVEELIRFLRLAPAHHAAGLPLIIVKVEERMEERVVYDYEEVTVTEYEEVE